MVLINISKRLPEEVSPLEVVYKTANDILLKAMPFIFRYVLIKMPPALQVAFLLYDKIL